MEAIADKPPLGALKVRQAKRAFHGMAFGDQGGAQNAGQGAGDQRRGDQTALQLDEDAVARCVRHRAASVEQHRLIQTPGRRLGKGALVVFASRRLVAQEWVTGVETFVREAELQDLGRRLGGGLMRDRQPLRVNNRRTR